MLSRPESLKSRVQGQHSKVTVETEFYFLAKELGCLGDLLGREYEVIYDDKGKIIGFRQKPITIPAFISMMEEMKKDYENQERQAKKANRGKR